MGIILKAIRSWRVQRAEPFGFHLWFDPTQESVALVNKVLTSIEECDRVVQALDSDSVSGPRPAASNDYPEDPEGRNQLAQPTLPFILDSGEADGS